MTDWYREGYAAQRADRDARDYAEPPDGLTADELDDWHSGCLRALLDREREERDD